MTGELTNDEIGELGEDLFKTWCSQARITAIRTTRDKHGWDYYLQLRVERGRHDPPERSCKVQVKTTIGVSPSADIKLSNWERMAKERQPWFVLHVVLDEQTREAREAYLVHIGEPEVARALKRLREVGPEAKIHQVEMPLAAPQTAALSHPFFESLRAAVIRDLGSSEEAYEEQKSAWVRRTGYEDHPYTVTVSMGGENKDAVLAQVADWAVGIVERIPITALRIAETRFGITMPVENIESSDGQMFFERLPSLGETVLTLSNRERSQRVSLRCSTHVASIIVPWLPPRHERLRLVGQYISFLKYPQDDGSVLSIRLFVPKNGAPIRLGDAADACKAMTLLARARGDGLRIEAEGLSSTDLTGLAFDPDPEFMRFADAMTAAAVIAKAVDIHIDTEVDPGELLAHDFHLTILAAGLDRRATGFDVRVDVASAEGVAGPRIAIVLCAEIPIGNHVVAGAIALLGAPEVHGEGLAGGATIGVARPEVRVCFVRVYPRETWDPTVMAKEVEATVESLRAEGVEPVVA